MGRGAVVVGQEVAWRDCGGWPAALHVIVCYGGQRPIHGCGLLWNLAGPTNDLTYAS